MALSWRALRHLILRGPDPSRDPYRLAFHHVPPNGRYMMHDTGYQRTLGGDGVALAVRSPYNNPIGAGIVPSHPMDIFGPPPAQYQAGAVIFGYPTPGQVIGPGISPGGPLYDPATIAALLGSPGTDPHTIAASSAATAAHQRMGF